MQQPNENLPGTPIPGTPLPDALWQQRPLRVLQIHNFYQQTGGEDVVVRHEAQILQQAGVALSCWHVDSSDIKAVPGWQKLQLALRLVWNRQAQQQLQQRLQQQPVDIIHVHNSFPLLSPAILHRAATLGVPVVMTMHNFRALHPQGFLTQQDLAAAGLSPVGVPQSRDPQTELPAGGRFRLGNALRFVGQALYRSSRLLTALLVVLIEVHRLMGSLRLCQRLICPSDFVKNVLLAAGFAPSQLLVKPHSMALPSALPKTKPGHYALFVGRADASKGLVLLLQAWQQLAYPLWLVGVSEEDVRLSPGYQPSPQLRFFGRQPPEALAELYCNASFLVVPSLCAETFGNVVIEAFAQGTPAVVSALGALPELVNATDAASAGCGLTFPAGSVPDLVHQCRLLLDNPTLLAQMSANAAARYQQRYLSSQNQQALLRCYQDLLTLKNRSGTHAPTPHAPTT